MDYDYVIDVVAGSKDCIAIVQYKPIGLQQLCGHVMGTCLYRKMGRGKKGGGEEGEGG